MGAASGDGLVSGGGIGGTIQTGGDSFNGKAQ
jgi:hypothetical protein